MDPINPETILGSIVFALVKLIGYRFLLAWIARYYRPHQTVAPIVVALVRILFGALVAGLVATAFHIGPSLGWYLVLVLARAIEWAVVIWFFYERLTGATRAGRLALFALLGTLVSCLLDLPGGFGGVFIPIMVYGFC